jgi:hypothetical protein
MCPYRDPDVFSLDVDGIDYHIAARILELGFRPKLWVVEYNPTFGPERSVAVPYSEDFVRWRAHESGLYYGASVAAWRKLFEGYAYEFITTDKSGTNAFFVDPAAFPEGFARSLKRVGFRDNVSDLNWGTQPRPDANGDTVLPPMAWRAQLPLIENMALVEI